MAALEGLGYVVDWFDRGSYRREDPVEVASLRAREDARALLIARDMPLLRNAEKGLDPLLPMSEIKVAWRGASRSVPGPHAGRRAHLHRPPA